MTAPPEARRTLPWPALAAAGIACFLAAAIALHLLRPDLDPVHSQMSLYLIGAHGAWLQAAYVALSIAMVGLAIGVYRSLAIEVRSAAPLLCFVLGGVSLSTTAYAWMDLPGVDASFEGWLHGTTAQAAFLFATTGIVLQALRLRRDPSWRAPARWLLPWAIACFAAVWALALWHDAPRGLAQKAVIALIVGWLAAVAWRLSRQRHARADSGMRSSPHRD